MAPNDFFAPKVRIIEAMQKANKPLINQHIAKLAKITPQLTNYHINQMIEWGIAGTYPIETDPNNTYYTLQPAYYDKKWLDALYLALTPFAEQLGKDLDLDQAQVDMPKAVVRNLSMFLRLFENKIEKLDLSSTSKV